jgi:uncharacterized protein (DUF2147 family)
MHQAERIEHRAEQRRRLNAGAKLARYVGALLVAALPVDAIAADLAGVWLTEGRDAAVAIGQCSGEIALMLCGRIVWLQNATDDSGHPRLDSRNPDPLGRSRPVCGLVVMGGLTPSGPNSWDGGTVYNPQDGRIYSGDMTMLSGTTLRVRAYLGVPFLGQSQIWTRAERTAAGIMEYNCRFVRVPPVPRQLSD